jgi:hypothetical protein
VKPHGCTSDVQSVGCIAVLRHPLVEGIYLFMAYSECALQCFGMVDRIAIAVPQELRLSTLRDEVGWRTQGLHLY